MTAQEDDFELDPFDSLVDTISGMDDQAYMKAVQAQKVLAAFQQHEVEWDDVPEQLSIFLEEFSRNNPAYDHETYLRESLGGTAVASDFLEGSLRDALGTRTYIETVAADMPNESARFPYQRKAKISQTALMSYILGHDETFWLRRMIDEIFPCEPSMGNVEQEELERIALAEIGWTRQETFVIRSANLEVATHGPALIADRLAEVASTILDQRALAEALVGFAFQSAVRDWDEQYEDERGEVANAWRVSDRTAKSEKYICMLQTLSYGAGITESELIAIALEPLKLIANISLRGIQALLIPESLEWDTEYDAYLPVVLPNLFPEDK